MVNVFFSYSHKDEELRNELEIHLSGLKRQNIISAWHDRRISAGEEFGSEISQYMESADIILLLVSPYFINSDYCYEIEMKRSMEKHVLDEAIIIPVILHPCDWHDMPFGDLMACPADGKPVSKFSNKHDAFLDITKAIKKNAVRLNKSQSEPNNPVAKARQKQTIIKQTIRSSNLRLKKEFTDRDKDKFLIESFEYFANFFEGSLQELMVRNTDIETDFRRVDANRFSSIVYKKGKEETRCNIFMGDGNPFLSGIFYSTGGFSPNSYNESFNVEDDDYKLYLKPLGMQFYNQPEKQKLTFEGGAEYYWSLFIENLQ